MGKQGELTNLMTLCESILTYGRVSRRLPTEAGTDPLCRPLPCGAATERDHQFRQVLNVTSEAQELVDRFGVSAVTIYTIRNGKVPQRKPGQSYPDRHHGRHGRLQVAAAASSRYCAEDGTCAYAGRDAAAGRYRRIEHPGNRTLVEGGEGAR